MAFASVKEYWLYQFFNHLFGMFLFCCVSGMFLLGLRDLRKSGKPPTQVDQQKTFFASNIFFVILPSFFISSLAGLFVILEIRTFSAKTRLFRFFRRKVSEQQNRTRILEEKKKKIRYLSFIFRADEQMLV